MFDFLEKWDKVDKVLRKTFCVQFTESVCALAKAFVCFAIIDIFEAIGIVMYGKAFNIRDHAIFVNVFCIIAIFLMLYHLYLVFKQGVKCVKELREIK